MWSLLEVKRLELRFDLNEVLLSLYAHLVRYIQDLGWSNAIFDKAQSNV